MDFACINGNHEELPATSLLPPSSFHTAREKRSHPPQINANAMTFFKTVSYWLLHTCEFLVNFQFSYLLLPEVFSDSSQTHALPSHSCWHRLLFYQWSCISVSALLLEKKK